MTAEKVKRACRIGSDICPISTMQDLHALIHDSDKVLSF